MSRLPVRLRLTLGFTGVLACLLATTAAFVYTRLVADLNAAIEQGQRARATELVSRAKRGSPFLSASPSVRLLDRNESFGEIADPDGRVLDASASLQHQLVLNPSELARAARRTITLSRHISGFDEEMRILATPMRFGSRRSVGIVGVALGDRNEATASLRNELVLAAPFALLIAALAAYGFAAAALRPVEAMRRRASTLSAELAGERLPLPAARDELSRLGETLNDLIARLEATLERERRFTTDASHELRTPLALLKAEIELALDGETPREELVAALRSAAEETDKLIHLANDLLLLARADGGSRSITAEPFDARPLLDRLRSRFAARAEREGRAIVVDADEQLETFADPARIEQALANLIVNALDHGAGTITVRAHRDGAAVELQVVDQGLGVDDQELPHLFERFRRGRRAHSERSGAGLGLAVVAETAQAHGGSVEASQTPDGFTIHLSLPAAPPGTEAG